MKRLIGIISLIHEGKNIIKIISPIHEGKNRIKIISLIHEDKRIIGIISQIHEGKESNKQSQSRQRTFRRGSSHRWTANIKKKYLSTQTKLYAPYAAAVILSANTHTIPKPEQNLAKLRKRKRRRKKKLKKKKKKRRRR